MSPPEAPNLERRSTNALLCFCIGAAAAGVAYFLGVGAVLAAVLTGGDPAIVVGSLFAALALGLLGMAGLVLMAVGSIWMFIQVVADQRGDPSEKRYRDVER